MSPEETMKNRSSNSAAEAELATQRSIFTNEFKVAAVARLKDGKQTVTALALELGIRRNLLYKWAKTLEQSGPERRFPSRGRKPANEESEVVRLRRELARAQEEVAILKKFDAYLKRLKQ
jgi:transposase